MLSCIAHIASPLRVLSQHNTERSKNFKCVRTVPYRLILPCISFFVFVAFSDHVPNPPHPSLAQNDALEGPHIRHAGTRPLITSFFPSLPFPSLPSAGRQRESLQGGKRRYTLSRGTWRRRKEGQEPEGGLTRWTRRRQIPSGPEDPRWGRAGRETRGRATALT